IVMAHLANRYGLFAEKILQMCVGRPELRERIVEGMPDILAEGIVACPYEPARPVSDVLLRRTRLGLLCARRLDQDSGAVKRVAKLMGSELGWGRRQTNREIEQWGLDAASEGIVTREPVSG